jgi:hypothetical protein
MTTQKTDNEWKKLHEAVERAYAHGESKQGVLSAAGVPANAYYAAIHKRGWKIASLANSKKPTAKGKLIEFVNPNGSSAVEICLGELKVVVKNADESTIRAVLKALEDR